MTAETWSAIAAFLALAIGALAYRAATQSARAATTLTDIERRRWHHDLTPKFNATAAAIMSGDEPSDMADLTIRFTGPTGLTALTIQPSIRNDRDRRSSGIGDATQEEIDAQIWGPYRFRGGGVDGVDQHGRTVAAFDLPLDDTRKLSLDRTQPPRWQADPAWRQDYDGTPVRLKLQCTHPDFEPWIIHLDVPVHRPGHHTAEMFEARP